MRSCKQVWGKQKNYLIKRSSTFVITRKTDTKTQRMFLIRKWLVAFSLDRVSSHYNTLYITKNIVWNTFLSSFLRLILTLRVVNRSRISQGHHLQFKPSPVRGHNWSLVCSCNCSIPILASFRNYNTCRSQTYWHVFW